MGTAGPWGRWLLLALPGIAIVAGAWAYLGGGISFGALLDSRARLEQAAAGAPILGALVFVLVYVAVTALSLPVATALSLLAGAVFGRLAGTLLVDVAATAGATLAFLASRFLLRDWVRARMEALPDPAWSGARARRARVRFRAWQTASEGIRASGLNYLLMLRLLPIVPFFGVNLVSGLSPLPVRLFVLGTLAGIFPATFLVVNAGAALGAVGHPGELLSLPFLAAVALLAGFSLVPVAWRRWRSA